MITVFMNSEDSKTSDLHRLLLKLHLRLSRDQFMERRPENS